MKSRKSEREWVCALKIVKNILGSEAYIWSMVKKSPEVYQPQLPDNVYDDWWLECRDVHPSASLYAHNYWENVIMMSIFIVSPIYTIENYWSKAEQVISIVKAVRLPDIF